jgi:hypothetical protein
MKLVTQINSALIVFRFDRSNNTKISNGSEKIVQVYSFDIAQKNYIDECDQAGVKVSPKQFFSLAENNCLDCPFRPYLQCYTHKYGEYMGMLSMLRSIKDIKPIDQIRDQILSWCQDRYIRFGQYGEPTLVPVDLVGDMVSVSKSHTGYTHQWKKRPEFSPYFMASTHSLAESLRAELMGFRSFVAVSVKIENKGFVQCPAAKETGKKSNCEKCGLCSGTKGKGKKSVQIIQH